MVSHPLCECSKHPAIHAYIAPIMHAAPAFDFESYMKERAVLVNKALDEALPLRYPEVLVESMRCGVGSTACSERHFMALCLIWDGIDVGCSWTSLSAAVITAVRVICAQQCS
jgi:hypothetical protein